MLTTLRPSLYLGIDAGATHTEAVIANESGYVLGKGYSEGANLHNISNEEACNHICEAIFQAETDLKSKKDHGQITYESLCVGMSGLDTQQDFNNVGEIFKQYYPERGLQIKHALFTNNGLIGLKSGTESNFGVCLVSGTGSNCYGISRKGDATKAGNWGYLLGDQGSAFSIGKAILEEVMKEYDGRLPQTDLTNAVLQTLNFKDASELINWVYNSRIPVKDIASLTKLSSHDDFKGLSIIRAQVDRAAKAMIDAYDAVFHKLKLSTDEPIPVVLIGGLFKFEKSFRERITAGIKQRTPQAEVILPKRSPAEGAIRIAMMADYLNILPDTITKIDFNH